ncbi:hypothetical protein [Mycetocola sp.]|uniref:hypothetical protein n=1 Tax=Mycetocola sp. TaxID=1871042 RepID=UPI003989F204
MTKPTLTIVDDFTDDLDSDFQARPVRDVIGDRLIRGESRRCIATDLGMSLESVNTEVVQLVREHSGAAGSYRERLALLHMQLDDVLDRIHIELTNGAGFDLAALAGVLVDVHRLRAGLLQAERPTRPSRNTDTNTEGARP